MRHRPVCSRQRQQPLQPAKSPCSRAALNREKLATLLVDLRTAELRFNIGLLAERLVGVTDWLARQPDTRALRIGYFGAGTGVLPPRSWWRQSVPGATH